MDTFLEQDREENMYAHDSLFRRSMGRLRSSFLMRIFNPGCENIRKKSLEKEDATKSPQHLRGYGNPALAPSCDKSGFSTPAVSRKSSSRTCIKKASPSQSRSSSFSMHPGNQNLRKHKNYDQQETDTQVSEDDNSDTPENGQPRSPSIISIANFEVLLSKNDKNSDMDNDIGGPKLDLIMPSIPEEPSRPYTASVDSTSPKNMEAASELDDVQHLVKEANEVLKELNRAISAQGHRQECKLKGYESCCSLSSDASSDESCCNFNGAKVNDLNSNEFPVVMKEDLSAGVKATDYFKV